jgi:hypothetical protein
MWRMLLILLRIFYVLILYSLDVELHSDNILSNPNWVITHRGYWWYPLVSAYKHLETERIARFRATWNNLR